MYSVYILFCSGSIPDEHRRITRQTGGGRGTVKIPVSSSSTALTTTVVLVEENNYCTLVNNNLYAGSCNVLIFFFLVKYKRVEKKRNSYGNKKKPVVVFVEFTFFIDAGAHVRVYTQDVWRGASYESVLFQRNAPTADGKLSLERYRRSPLYYRGYAGPPRPCAAGLFRKE